MVINHKVTHKKLTLAMGSVSADFALQFDLNRAGCAVAVVLNLYQATTSEFIATSAAT